MRTIGDAAGGKNNFDAIRLFAAVGVIFSHAYPATQGSNAREPLYIFSGAQVTIGEVCVAIFFIVSGYLITQSFLRSRSVIEYFAHRLLRIVPALAVMTLLTCLILGPIITTATQKAYWSSYMTWRYLGNALVYPGAQRLLGVFELNKYPYVTNASIWTLSYEFSCYILVAALGLLYHRKFLTGSTVFVVALFTIFGTYISFPIFLIFFGYFFAGAAAFCLRNLIPLDRRIFALSVIVIYLAAALGVGLKACLCVFGAYIVFFVTYSDRLRVHEISRYGDFSYGVYLYAWPVQQLMVFDGSTPFTNFLLSIPFVFCFAYLSWKFVEYPCLSKKISFSNFLNQGYLYIIGVCLSKKFARSESKTK
jgi:peptidoglycan/LPS O-acetylase OafA/YrhL